MSSSDSDLEKEGTGSTSSQSRALQRKETHKRQHAETVGATKPSETPREKLFIGDGKPLPPSLPPSEEYVVEFEDAHDPHYPHNWSTKKKLTTGAIAAYATICASFGSSMWSSGSGLVAEQFGVSTEVTTLGLALYVFGFATGPIVWGPLSELRGRKICFVIGAFGLGVFLIGVAVAKDLQTIFICRFCAGVFGAAPVNTGAAVIADMYNNSQRGIGVSIYSLAGFGGPFVAPFVGGFIADSYLGWRWTQYLAAIMAFSSLILIVFCMAESYPPVILISKAKRLRRETKNWGIHAKQEEVEVDLKDLIHKNLTRPLRLLFTEPIVLLLSIYCAFIYGLLYVFLTAYPIVFQVIRGMNRGVGSLPLLAMVVGELFACLYLILEQPSYLKKLKANNDVNVPEWRLPPMMVGGILYSIGLLWFGWAGYLSSVSWVAPMMSGIFTGFGNYIIILQVQNYLLDAYPHVAASVIAANAIARSLAGAGFPMFASYMYSGIGVQWTQTLLGCVAALMVPIPVLFYKFGSRIRQRSKFA